MIPPKLFWLAEPFHTRTKNAKCSFSPGSFPFHAGEIFFSFLFWLLVSYSLPRAKVEFANWRCAAFDCWKHLGCVLCVSHAKALLEAPHVPQGTSFAPASSLCPLLIPPGSLRLHWLPGQFGDFRSEKRHLYRLGRVFLVMTLWYCWDRIYTRALCSRTLCWTGTVLELAGQRGSARALNIPWHHRIKLAL